MSERSQGIAPSTDAEAPRRFGRGRIAKMAATAVAAVVAAVGVGEAANPASAEAAAYAQSVSKPRADGNTVEGRARINTDCEGTVGCWSYIKLQYKADNPATPSWLNSWQSIDGQWASDGRNEVSADARPGCGYYRTVVNSYNDFYAETGAVGISAGVRGMEIGVERVQHGVDRLHTQSISAAARICLTA